MNPLAAFLLGAISTGTFLGYLNFEEFMIFTVAILAGVVLDATSKPSTDSQTSHF